MKNEELNTLLDLLIQSSDKYSDSVALAVENYSISFKKLSYYSDLLAGFLQNKGVGIGDHIALLSENSPEWGIVFFGILKTGATVVCLDIFHSEDELKYILTCSEASYILASKQQIGKLKTITESVSSVRELLDTEIIYQNDKPDYNPISIDKDSTAVLIYTSGTMGVQKGVVLTHSNIISNIIGGFEHISFEPGTMFCSLIPLSHMFGLNAGFLAPLYHGAPITYSKSLKGTEVLNTLKQTKTEVLVLVPLILKKFYNNIIDKIQQLPYWKRIFIALAKNICGSLTFTGLNPGKILFWKIHKQLGGHLKFFICGGSVLDIRIERFFNTIGIPVLNGYGLTETSPIVSVNSLKERKFGSVGKVIPKVKVKFGKGGEILVKGPNVMKGYYKNQEATNRVISESWFMTGDIGELDPDGFLFIKERIKNVIVLPSGLKIFPNEIESLVMNSRYISEICIVKRKIGQEECPYAVIYPDYNLFMKVSEDTILLKIKEELEYYQKSLPSYKKVLQFELSDKELPKSSTKKIKRKLVEDSVQNKHIDKIEIKDRERLTDEKEILVAGIIKRFLKRPELELGRNTYLRDDLGIDSIMKIELLCDIEKEIHISIPEESIYNIETFSDLINTLYYQKVDKERVELKEITIDIPDEKLKGRPVKVTKTVTMNIISGLLQKYFRLKVKNLSLLPKSGNYIIAANHTSMLDFPLLCSTLPKHVRKTISAPAAHDYFYKKSFLSWLLRNSFNIFPMKRHSDYYESLKSCSRILNTGTSLVLFPEGTRSITGTLQSFKPGIGLLSLNLGIPVVPVYIKGAYTALPKGAWFPKFHKIEVKIGKSVLPNEFKSLLEREPKYIVYQKLTEKIRTSIEELATKD